MRPARHFVPVVHARAVQEVQDQPVFLAVEISADIASSATVPGAMCSIPQPRERSSSRFGVSVSADAAGKNRSSRNVVLSGLLSGLGQEAVHLQPLLEAIQITVRATAFRDETVGTHLEYVKFRLQAGFDPGAEQVD